jgi:hypothetical protein
VPRDSSASQPGRTPGLSPSWSISPIGVADEAWASDHDSRDRSKTDEAQDGNGRLGRCRREQELEERDWVTPFGLQRSHGAATAAHDEGATFDHQKADAGPQAIVTAARRGTPPDVGKARQLGNRPGCVQRPPRPRPTPEIVPRGRRTRGPEGRRPGKPTAGVELLRLRNRRRNRGGPRASRGVRLAAGDQVPSDTGGQSLVEPVNAAPVAVYRSRSDPAPFTRRR